MKKTEESGSNARAGVLRLEREESMIEYSKHN